jgi:hypothetical protein
MCITNCLVGDEMVTNAIMHSSNILHFECDHWTAIILGTKIIAVNKTSILILTDFIFWWSMSFV